MKKAFVVLGFLSFFLIILSASALIINLPYQKQISPFYCGEASLSMVLNYYGIDVNQSTIGDAIFNNDLQTTTTDKMASYPLTLGLNSTVLNGADIPLIENYLNEGYPLIVLQRYSWSSAEGHFRVVIGFDENCLTMCDSDLGSRYNLSYSDFANFWNYDLNWSLLIQPFPKIINQPSPTPSPTPTSSPSPTPTISPTPTPTPTLKPITTPSPTLAPNDVLSAQLFFAPRAYFLITNNSTQTLSLVNFYAIVYLNQSETQYYSEKFYNMKPNDYMCIYLKPLDDLSPITESNLINYTISIST